jgi:DNA-3-methyladenine glycosylase II
VSRSLTIETRGPFSLRAAAEFGFGPHAGRAPAFDGAMRLAFPIDGGEGYAGVVVRQPRDDGPLACEVQTLKGTGTPKDAGIDLTAVEGQIARVLSLDHDGEAYLELGERDPVIGELQRRHPGQRPVLFYSPYEAAAWSVISARRQPAQAAKLRRELGANLGQSFELAGGQVAAFPQPDRLLEAVALPGFPEEKIVALRGIAQAALDGALDVGALHRLGAQAAWSTLQELRAIGPFYATLIVLRASGFADAPMPVAEPRVQRHAARFYQLAGPPSLAEFTALAEAWRPFRTWATVLLRLAGDREFGSGR